MDGPREEATPAAATEEVLRAKRLEIVDDEGRIRASLGTREEGIGGLAVFDASGRRRIALEAGEVDGQGSGLSLLDTNGKTRAVVYAHNDPKKGTAVYLGGEDGTARATLALDESGQAFLSVSAGEKNRQITVAVDSDGGARLTFTGEGPAIGLGSFGEDQASPSLILADEKGQGGMVLYGSRYKPYLRFRDPAGEVRAGLELTPGGELDVTSFGDGHDAGRGDKRYHGFLWAFSMCLLVIGGAFVGVWVTDLFFGEGGAVQTGTGLSLGAFAVVTSLVIAALVTLLDYFRR